MKYNPLNHTTAVMRTGLVCCLVWTTLSSVMADETEQLQIEVEALERQLLELTEPQLGLPAEEIRKQIKRVFQAKQRLAETQLQMLADRVKYMETEIQRRSENEEQIVERRLAELLDRREARIRELERVQSEEQAVSEQPDSGHAQESLLGSEIESARRDRDEMFERLTKASEREAVNQRLAAEAARTNPSELTFTVYKLKLIKAKQAYEVLSNFLSDKNFEGVRAAYDEHTNAILLQGTEEAHELTRKLIERLDQPPLEADTSPAAKPNDNESTDQRKIRFMVSIPSENMRSELLVRLTQEQSQLEETLASASRKYAESHPTVAGLRKHLETIRKGISDLSADLVSYNILLTPKTRELAQDILQAERGENGLAREVKATFAPQGHLQLRGPRLSVEALGDKIVKLLNQSADSREQSILKITELLEQAQDELSKRNSTNAGPSVYDELQMKLKKQIAQFNRQLEELSTHDSQPSEAKPSSEDGSTAEKEDH